MNTIRTRILRLERSVELKRCAAGEERLPAVFETMRLSSEDDKLLYAISEQGPSTALRKVLEDGGRTHPMMISPSSEPPIAEGWLNVSTVQSHRQTGRRAQLHELSLQPAGATPRRLRSSNTLTGVYRGNIESVEETTPEASVADGLRCSFCSRSGRLLCKAGTPPSRAYICARCVRVFYEILQEDQPEVDLG
jgi:ClpX C4-type zinc finger